MRTAEFFAFIKERWLIYVRRQEGQKRPWTKDKILQSYRFCNVHRENDTVTKWIADNWRYPHRKDPDLWFAMTVARMFNLPATLAVLGYPVPFKPEHVRKAVQRIQNEGITAYSAAYMIRCDIQAPGRTKVDYLVDKVFTALWRDRADIRPRKGDRLEQFHSRLLAYYGMGSFMAGQVVADTKFVQPLKSAEDWWSWAAPGPGSQRGLNRVLERPVNAPWRADEWLRQLNLLQTKIDPLCKAADIPRLSAQDLQNCLCEADKWWRAKNGEGRPKQKYPGV